MNAKFINDNIQSEQCEHRGSSSGSLDLERSQDKDKNGNSGIKFYTEISYPIDTPPKKSSIPIIERPCYTSHLDWFELNGKMMKPGLYWHGKGNRDGDGEEPSEIDEWISAPLIIEGITSSSDDEEFGRLLCFVDSNGKTHKWAMPMQMLKGSGEELRGELLDQGFIFNPKKRSDLLNYIMMSRPNRRITAASRIGWQDDVFVLPNQIIGEGDIVFQSESASDSDFRMLGSLKSWKQNIGSLCIGNVPLMVSVSAALAGPLLKLVNRQNGGGIHFVGDSSSGKSTAVEIAASVWGSPEFIRSWSATANGLEGVAATRNDTCLILDEIDEAYPHEIGKIVYMLVNGQGKQRAGRTGNARKIQRWSIIAISTGERTLNSIMNEAGLKANTGQLVRLLSIPAAFEHGVFSNLHGFNSGRELSDHLKMQRLKNYGHIGPAFIQNLLNEKRDLTMMLEQINEKFCGYVSNSIEGRASGVFSVIGLAGELGIEYGLLPWNQGSALDAAVIALKRWKEFQGSGQNEDTRILNAVSDFISKHGDSRFSEVSDPSKVQNRAGWYKIVAQDRVFMFLPNALEEAGAGFERPRIVAALNKAGWISEFDKDGRYTKKTRVSGRSIGLYHICEKEF